MTCRPAMPPSVRRSRHLLEVDRPILLAHRLEHLDGCDTVIRARLVAVVLQLDVNPVGQALLENALLRVVVLFLRDGEARDARADLLAGELREAAPAAADFEHMVLGPTSRGLRQRAVFAGLGEREVVLALEVQRGRVGHRPVQPGFVEAIAEVVVRVDVTRASRACVLRFNQWRNCCQIRTRGRSSSIFAIIS